jgi:hypothetical protein
MFEEYLETDYKLFVKKIAKFNLKCFNRYRAIGYQGAQELKVLLSSLENVSYLKLELM